MFSIDERELERVLRGVSDPEQLAVGENERYLYVASEDTVRAVIMDVDAAKTAASLPAGGEPGGVGISSSGCTRSSCETAPTGPQP